jgi:hypothetical protein
MSKYARKVDKNQAEIVGYFRDLECTVKHLHMVGGGCPDILVGVMGINLLVEIKSPGGSLEKSQESFISDWKGQVCVVVTREDVIKLVNDTRRKYADRR